ncbi:nitroreductase [Haliea sp. E17]|uniref:nitroreductase n=1 Tax=Haliea sp. E17 TaxID=3401576 RepID=UPI003AAC3769
MQSMSVTQAVTSRRTVRAFLDTPVPLEVIRRVLDTARMAPSGCNFQPWEATVLTGGPLSELQGLMRQSPMQDPPEYAIQPRDIPAMYTDRLVQMGAKQYAAMGVARDDTEARQAKIMENVVSFGAPVLLLCYFPRVMGPPQWSDVGMWLQTIMLLLREAGLDSCPQEFLSMYARLIKEFIGVDDTTHVFFCGMGIGYRDPEAPVNNFERGRVPLDEQVRFAGF